VKIKLDENICRRAEQLALIVLSYCIVAPTQVGAYRAAARQLDKWIPAFEGVTQFRFFADVFLGIMNLKM
jgi:hypothetical protein